MKQLTCPNKKCNYSWNYDGIALFYATCPICLWKVRINRTAEELQLIEEIKKIKEEEEEKERGEMVTTNREEDV